MLTRSDTDNKNLSLFDEERDLDLVAAVNNAQSEAELQSVVRMSCARLRARRSELKAGQAPRRHATNRRSWFSPRASVRG
jgi:hypothetical protein